LIISISDPEKLQRIIIIFFFFFFFFLDKFFFLPSQTPPITFNLILQLLLTAASKKKKSSHARLVCAGFRTILNTFESSASFLSMPGSVRLPNCEEMEIQRYTLEREKRERER
jgi:hypothetical protein